MAILKRINKFQGLKDIDVLVEESGITSQFFNIYEVPDALPQGRSSFLLAGSQFLKNNVELQIEILDSAGNTVYTEPVQSYLEGNARRVSIEIYDDTAPLTTTVIDGPLDALAQELSSRLNMRAKKPIFLSYNVEASDEKNFAIEKFIGDKLKSLKLI